jgi:hypothetical protein
MTARERINVAESLAFPPLKALGRLIWSTRHRNVLCWHLFTN